jgi:hypothetical protein
MVVLNGKTGGVIVMLCNIYVFILLYVYLRVHLGTDISIEVDNPWVLGILWHVLSYISAEWNRPFIIIDLVI